MSRYEYEWYSLAMIFYHSAGLVKDDIPRADDGRSRACFQLE